MLDTLFIILWLIATITIFVFFVNRTSVISFNGLSGFFEAYLGVLIESGVVAAIIVGVPLWILHKAGIYIIGGMVIIIVIVAILKKGGKGERETAALSKTVDEGDGRSSREKMSDVRFCHNCGKKLNGGEAFCGNCGEKVKMDT